MSSMQTQIAGPTPCLRWPAERFYWAVLDGMGWNRPGEVPPGLLESLADEVPVPVEELHAVGVPVRAGEKAPSRLLVCACPAATLRTLDPCAASLSPEGIPALLGVSADASRINLLVGAFEPPAVRASRRARHLVAAATVLVCAALASIGMMRRASAASEHARQAGLAADALLRSSAPDGREATVLAHLQAATSLAERARAASPPPDAAAAFHAFLRAWPSGSSAQVQGVSVGSDGVSFGVVVQSDPAAFITSLKAPEGFRFDEPRLAAAGGVVRINMHMKRAEAKRGAP